jgi:hypothetical protein
MNKAFEWSDSSLPTKSTAFVDKFDKSINHPSHYQGIKIKGKNGEMEFEAIEIIDSILTNLNLSPAVSHAIGDALKYILRCGKKESDNSSTSSITNKAANDLGKSAFYCNRGKDLLLSES